jgi:hypothetical protein
VAAGIAQLPSHLPIPHRTEKDEDEDDEVAGDGSGPKKEKKEPEEGAGLPACNGTGGRPGRYLHQPELREKVPGFLGKLRIHQSGRATMLIGEIEYEVLQVLRRAQRCRSAYHSGEDGASEVLRVPRDASTSCSSTAMVFGRSGRVR